MENLPTRAKLAEREHVGIMSYFLGFLFVPCGYKDENVDNTSLK
jgi:hypothetical protein